MDWVLLLMVAIAGGLSTLGMINILYGIFTIKKISNG